MSATTFAPRPEPRRRPAAPQLPPHLRLVEAQPRERRLTRLVTGVLVAAIFAGLFSIVALRVLVAQGQVDIDRLTSSIEAKQAEQQGLRMTVAQLEAPDHVVAAARQRLGMITPATVTYLTPIGGTGAGAPTR